MTTTTGQQIKNRQDKLGTIIAEEGLDALVLNAGPSIIYMTGMHFHLSERPIFFIVAPGKTPVLVLPELEAAKTLPLDYPLEVVTYPEDLTKWATAVKVGVEKAGLSNQSKIGAEARQLRMLELDFLKQALPKAEFSNANAGVAQLRLHKDAAEQDALQRAANIAQKGLEETLPLLKIGMTEKEAQAELIMQLYRQGSGSPFPFMPIVASGPLNSANPHASASDNKLSPGDLLVIDWGANVDEYFSDLTRTFAIGTININLNKIHTTVQEANQAAHAIAGPGVACGAVDKAARDVIEAAGFGEYFIHRLGHGLGVETHEAPYMRGDNEQLLEPGMVFTIEPGIYISGTGGVRIEDDVVVTEDGIHSFSDMFRGLRVIG